MVSVAYVIDFHMNLSSFPYAFVNMHNQFFQFYY